MAAKTDERDGFEVVEMSTGEVVRFIPCEYNSENMRERALMGLLMNADTDRFFIRDTRDN